MKSTRSWKPICGCVTYVSHVSLPLNRAHVCPLSDKRPYITSFPPQPMIDIVYTLFTAGLMQTVRG